MGFNIAIDGPAGAGKSTIAKRAAEELAFVYVDTGAMYRAIGLYMERSKVEISDETAVAAACEKIDVSIAYQDGEQRVLLDGEDVSSQIRNEQIGGIASKISSYPVVREKLLLLQRFLALKSDVIMDGRDIGTCILPHADVKIYLTADAGVRARRRCLELTRRGERADFETVYQDILKRDHQDMTRAVSPLKKAEDAVSLDTSDMTIEEVVKGILGIVHERMNRDGSRNE